MTEIEHEAIKAAIKTRDRALYWVKGDHTNPFTTSMTIYDCKTHLLLGTVKECSPDIWGDCHWALVDVPVTQPPLVILSFQMGTDYSRYGSATRVPQPPDIGPPPFHIGQRKFQRNWTAQNEMNFIGVIVRVYTSHSGREWVCSTSRGVLSYPSEFKNNQMFIGQREHRGKTQAQLRAAESTSE